LLSLRLGKSLRRGILLAGLKQDPLLLAMVRLLAVLHRTCELVEMMAWAYVMGRPLNPRASSAF